MCEITVAIIDPFHARTIETIARGLPAGWELRVAEGRSLDAHKAAFAPAEAAFVMATPVGAELLDAAPRLGFIQKLGAGVDRIDLATCAARGIGVARLHAGNAIPVAEHTVMLMLAACRRLPVLDRATRAGGWDKEECRGNNRHMRGKTVGLVGFGAIGRAVARLLSGFGVTVLYFDPVRADPELETQLGVAYAGLDDLLAGADIVSLHVPLMPETRGLIDRRRIGAMKPGAILVNCARGGLVDEAALYEALTAGRLGGAALDAFATEPPAGNPLLGLESCIVTPHAAGATIDNVASLVERAVRNTRAWLAGEALPPANVVVAPKARTAAA